SCGGPSPKPNTDRLLVASITWQRVHAFSPANDIANEQEIINHSLVLENFPLISNSFFVNTSGPPLPMRLRVFILKSLPAFLNPSPQCFLRCSSILNYLGKLVVLIKQKCLDLLQEQKGVIDGLIN